MPRVLVHSTSPVQVRMWAFAASRVPDLEVTRCDEPADALRALLEDGPWDLAVICFDESDSLLEACVEAGIPTLVGICIDDAPSLEARARRVGVTHVFLWPLQARVVTAMIEERLSAVR